MQFDSTRTLFLAEITQLRLNRQPCSKIRIGLIPPIGRAMLSHTSLSKVTLISDTDVACSGSFYIDPVVRIKISTHRSKWISVHQTKAIKIAQKVAETLQRGPILFFEEI